MKGAKVLKFFMGVTVYRSLGSHCKISESCAAGDVSGMPLADVIHPCRRRKQAKRAAVQWRNSSFDGIEGDGDAARAQAG